jgi:DNA-binding NarL/FixJ family response regulator
VATTNSLLTPEEREILILASLHHGTKHLSYKEISLRRGISVNRVKTIIHQAIVKLGASNRNEAVYLAVRRGEIHLNELLPLDELAEILCSLDPGELKLIADLVRRNQIRRSNFPEKAEHVIRNQRRQAGLLTNRERDVLILASYGLENAEIAEKLCMTSSAVRTFLNRAFSKLGARKRADAVQLALKHREIYVGEISSEEELAYFLAPYGADTIEKIADRLDNDN